jgi:sugar (glycoside-pentoside-hexuronide) transporter
MNARANPLPAYIKLGWAVGELGVALFIGITMIFMLFFLTEGLGISPVLAGLALLIPRIWDLLMDPVIGAVSDRTRTRLGRRRLFLLVGSLAMGPLFALTFAVPPAWSEYAKVAYVTLLYLLASTAYSLFDVPYSAMAAEFTSDYRERTNLVSYKEIAARVGIMLAVLASPVVFTSQTSLAAGFRLLGILGGAFITIAGLVAFVTTRDAPRQVATQKPFRLRDEFVAIVENRPFRILWLAFLAQNTAIGASSTAVIYLITIVMRADAKVVGPLIAIGSIIGIFVTPLWALAARRWGKRGGYVLALAIVTVMSLPALFIPPSMYMLLFAVLLVAGVGDAGTQLLSGSMVPDTVEVDEQRTGMRREGAIFGAWIFCRKLGMAAGAFLVSIGLSLFGFVGGDAGAGSQTELALTGIRIIYCVVPCALYLLTMLLLSRYDLSEARFNAVKAQIAGASP